MHRLLYAALLAAVVLSPNARTQLGGGTAISDEPDVPPQAQAWTPIPKAQYSDYGGLFGPQTQCTKDVRKECLR